MLKTWSYMYLENITISSLKFPLLMLQKDSLSAQHQAFTALYSLSPQKPYAASFPSH